MAQMAPTSYRRTEEEMACPWTVLRVPLIEPGTESPEVTPIYDTYREMFGMVPRYIQLLAHVPAIAHSWMIFDRDVKVPAIKSADPRMARAQVLAILKTSMINMCNNCTMHNIELGITLGLPEEKVHLVEHDLWRESDQFSPEERAVIGWAETVTRIPAAVSEAAFEDLKHFFTDAEIVEITYTVGLWNCSNRVAESLGLVVEPQGHRIDWEHEEHHA